MYQILFRKAGPNGLKIGFGLKIAISGFGGEVDWKMGRGRRVGVDIKGKEFRGKRDRAGDRRWQ
jgi:hypothetical protein